ncbi:tripartite tricarboxylate transporter substrate binding protein [Pigmentiphaga sp. CHJ604]|uniref:Bug family tripartite tricarboxylate transporter substrate binding protein n=1 Tax=Pigmentiphaga sp. CHJ604 TaxID=3081984 RepID=UPI0030D3BD65
MTLNNRVRLLGIALSLGAAPAALAQAYPSKPIKFITASTGSPQDVVGRIFAQKITETTSHPVVVESRAGAGALISIQATAKAPADGYNVLVSSTAFAVTPYLSSHIATHPHTFRKLPYDPRKDFEPIRPILNTAFFVVVGANSPYKTLGDIIRAAREQPGRVTYGSWFVGSPGHLGGLRLQSLKGIEMLHVPFKDMGQLMAAVTAGEVGWTLGSDASAGPLEKAGKLRYLAIAAPTRSPIHPQVPSVDESPDTKGYDVQAWVGLFAPPGTPEAIKQRISDDVAAVLKSPQIVERYRLLGYENPDLDPGQFAARIQRDTDAWGAVIKQAGLRLDD